MLSRRRGLLAGFTGHNSNEVKRYTFRHVLADHQRRLCS